MNRCSSILAQPSYNKLKPLCALKKVALSILACTLVLICCIQNQAFASSVDHAISDNSFSLEKYLGEAREKQANHITIGADLTSLGSANFDWKVNLVEGYRTGFGPFSGPRKAELGRVTSGTQEIHFSHPDKLTFKNFTIASVATLVVEPNSHVIFEDVTFKNKPLIKGFAEFRNCKFEAGAVEFAGGDATYTDGTVTPTEEGNKGGAHLPLSIVLSSTHAEGVIDNALNAEANITLEGSNKDRAKLEAVTPDNMLGLSASIVDKKLVINGTPTADGELDLVVRASAEADGDHEADDPVEKHFTVKIYPKVSLELEGELPATARYEKLYQRALKLKIKVGDKEPVDAYTFWTTDPDAKNSAKPEVISTPALPGDAKAYWLYDGVTVTSNLPAASGVFQIKVRMQIKGQTVESNSIEFRIWEGNESLKQQLDSFWIKQGKPARWLAEPYSIEVAGDAVIPNELKVLMGSDCHNSEKAKEESDAEKEKEKQNGGTTPASFLFGKTTSDSLSAPAFARTELTNNKLTAVKDSSKSSYTSKLFKRISERLTSSYKNIDGITMASGGGSSGGSISGGGGVGGSGSCQYLVVGKSENGAYATDSIIIPAGTNVEFLNVKVRSSVKIVVQKGGKLTLNDSAIQGLIEVEEGGTLSGKYSSSSDGKIIFKDGSKMDNLELKSFTNHIREDDKTRPISDCMIEIHGNVTATGANKFLGDTGAPGAKSQTAVKLTEGSKLTIEKGATLEALGGESWPYSKGGGDAIEMAEGSTIDGKGTLIAKGGSGYEAPGGGGVIGSGTIATAKATITGGNGKSLIGHEAPGGFGIDGTITVDRTTNLTVKGGEGVDEKKQPVDPTPAFNPEHPNPQPVQAVKLRVRHVDAASVDSVTGASLKGQTDLKTLDYNVGDVIPLNAIAKPIEGYKLVKIRLHDHRHSGASATHAALNSSAPASTVAAESINGLVPVSFRNVSSLVAANSNTGANDAAPTGPQPAAPTGDSINIFGMVMDLPETLTLDINDMVVELFYEKEDSATTDANNAAWLYTQAENAIREREAAEKNEEKPAITLVKRYLPKTGQEASVVAAIVVAAGVSLAVGSLLYKKRSRS